MLLSSVSQVHHIYCARHISSLYNPTHFNRKSAKNDWPQSTVAGIGRLESEDLLFSLRITVFIFTCLDELKFTLTGLLVLGKLWAPVKKQKRVCGLACHRTDLFLLHRCQNSLCYSFWVMVAYSLAYWVNTKPACVHWSDTWQQLSVQQFSIFRAFSAYIININITSCLKGDTQVMYFLFICFKKDVICWNAITRRSSGIATSKDAPLHAYLHDSCLWAVMGSQ